jgi:hypothetical protein
MAVRNPSSKISALKLVTKTARTKARKTSDRKAIVREFLNGISIEEIPQPPKSVEQAGGGRADLVNNHFACGASQVNTDLALAAQCESEGDIYTEDDTFFDLCASSEYLKLRQTFVDGALGSRYALSELVWRAYNAGRLSSDRLEPASAYARTERRRREELHNTKST